MRTETRRLQDLISVGPATLCDFEVLKVRSVAELARRNPRRMYRQLCQAKKELIDVCCLDVLTAAVAQARDPELPVEHCQWWYWSRQRKAGSRQNSSNKSGSLRSGCAVDAER